MGKRGGSTHLKRIVAPKAIPITDKKARTWIIKSAPGPHPLLESIPLGVLLRDVLHVVKDLREARKVLSKRFVLVDGIPRTTEKFAVGLMDVVSLIPENKNYRIVVDWKGRLHPVEITAEEGSKKIVKVIKKIITKGGRINLTFHDSRNIVGDNHIHVGDSVIIQLPKSTKEKIRVLAHLKLEKGARCFVSKGKHAGKIVRLKDVIKRLGRKSEAIVETEKGEEFITVSDYLVVVDDSFKISSEGGAHG
ncbi:MAG: 30S ribosomal protein S4e [Candidatus Bilamarchaeaceae archaeon]